MRFAGSTGIDLASVIRSDNGPEFTAKAVRGWLGQVGMKTLFIEPGNRWENGYNESFNGKLRDERRHYNTIWPHSSLGYRSPAPEAVLPRPAGPAFATLPHAPPGAPWHGSVLS